MSAQNENRLDDAVLDRLVDGELTDAEYRETVCALDANPDGWRRCALAFLEAQAWGREFRLARVEGLQPATAPAASHRRMTWLYAGLAVAACAASFMLAFGIANLLQSRRTPNLPSNDQLVVQPPGGTSNGDLDPGLQFATNSHSPNAEIDTTPWGRYRLVVNGGAGTAQEVEMPVFAADDPRAGLLLDENATVPHELIRALRNSGNEVRLRRNWIQDRSGAPLYVPVDELQITPVSNRSFQ